MSAEIQSRFSLRSMMVPAAVSVLLMLGGCMTAGKQYADPDPRFVRPTVAILDFENKAPFPHNWSLGSGMRDLLVDELVKSGRYTVLTRRDLGTVVNEIQLQDSELFRKQGRAAAGKLKNVKYLVRGAVTDFAHVKGGWTRAVADKVAFWASRNVAVVGVTIYVIHVETGEILASESLEGRASAGELSLHGQYRNVVFGGGAFYRTPLGRATKEVLGQAVTRIAEAIARQPWRPRVVKVADGAVFVSGGEERGISAGALWSVVAEGEELFDPETGDSLGRLRGETVGKIRIDNVSQKYAVGTLVEGRCEKGQALEPVVPTPQ